MDLADVSVFVDVSEFVDLSALVIFTERVDSSEFDDWRVSVD